MVKLAKLLTYTNVLRFMYVQGIVWTGVTAFLPEISAQMFGAPTDIYKDEGMNYLRQMMVAGMVTWTLLAIAAAQCDEAAQRKFLQYNIGTFLFQLPLLGVSKSILDRNMWIMNICMACANIAISLVAVYIVGKPKASKSGNVGMTRVLRFSYAILLYNAATTMLSPANGPLTQVFNITSKSPYFWLMSGVWAMLAFGASLIFMAIAQVDVSSQKKVLQYFLGSLLFRYIWSFVWNGAGMNIAAGANGAMKLGLVDTMLLLWIVAVMYVIYPANLTKWILRQDYILKFATGVWWLVDPKFACTVWGLSAETAKGFTQHSSFFIGLMMITLAAGSMAVAKEDEATQRKYIQYVFFLPFFVVLYGVFARGLDCGQGLGYFALVTAVATWNLYGDYFKAKLGGGGAKSGRSRSPKGRKRSATPGARK